MQIAFQASADGDLVHSAFHIGCVLAVDPMDRRALGLLDRLISKCQDADVDPLTLAPTDGKSMYVGTAALRCHVLANVGQWREAVELLRQMAHHDAQRPWWRWGADWLARDGVAAQAEAVQGVGLMAGVIMRHTDTVVPPSNTLALAELEEALPAARALARAHPNDEMSRFLFISTVRKLNRLDEAAAEARRFWNELPGYYSAATLGIALRAMGDIQGAAQAWENALAHNPEDASIRADLAEMWCAAGQFDEALKWADQARKFDRERTTSSHILAPYIRYCLTGDASELERLKAFRAQHPELRIPTQDAMQRLGAYATYIPEAQEAIVNAVRNMLAEHPELRGAMGSNKMDFAVTSTEVPSARVAIEMELGMPRGRLTVAIERIPSPDPRVPRGPVEWLLWTFEGSDPAPALQPPSPAVSEVVASVAATRYDVERWFEQACDAVARLRKQAADPAALAEQLLAVMIHPPKVPDQAWYAWDWVRAVQFASAMLIARIDDGWSDSLRRRALLSLATGPVDWTTEAAIVALACVAREKNLPKEARQEIHDQFAQLNDALPDIGYCNYDQALEWAIRWLGGENMLPGGRFDRLMQRLQREE